VIAVSEDPQPGAAADAQPGAVPDTPVSPGRDVTPAEGRRLSGLVAGRLADQVQRTTQAARAGRVANTGGEPGVLDLTPLRELVSELTEELRKAGPRERIARVLRQAADIIDPPAPVR
jgi:hypothetical protein